MKIVVDRHIPYLEGVLPRMAEVLFLEPQDITAETVRDADALIVRTRTRCDEALLQGSKVQFIATATIGFDHIDRNYCDAHHIVWTNCPGCNAQGVADYVETVLHYWVINGLLLGHSATGKVGIVGVGHVGKLVEQMAREKGWDVLLCDPPRAEKEGADAFVALEQIARECDVITFHTPLTRDGLHPTYHLADEAFFRTCRADALIINAARGGVVDEAALLKSGNPFVLDCWEGEPEINRDSLNHALFATFHIAGYTREGKYNASQMSLNALCRHFGLPTVVLPNRPEPAPRIWDIEAVSQALKEQPDRFEQLRSAYILR